jgi:hypothetical protein
MENICLEDREGDTDNIKMYLKELGREGGGWN